MEMEMGIGKRSKRLIVIFLIAFSAVLFCAAAKLVQEALSAARMGGRTSPELEKVRVAGQAAATLNPLEAKRALEVRRD
jgi:hypothetical protein